jgi:hypothetical protein
LPLENHLENSRELPDNGNKPQEVEKAGAGYKYNEKFIFVMSMIYLIFLRYMKISKNPREEWNS